MKRIVRLVALATFAASATNVFAVNIFSNPITDPNPSTANPFAAGQTFDPNITVTGVGRGLGITANAGSNRYNAASWSFPGFDANDYFAFTLTPNAGYEIDFASLSGAWQRSGTGPNSYILKSSLDNFASSIATGGITGSGSPSNYNISLSAVQDVTSAIEFRLYGFAGTGGTGTFSFNDFTFDGTVSQITIPPDGTNGDFNEDGTVDAGDYVTWLKNSGTSNALANDNGLGTPISTAHFDLWRANFGNPEVIGSGAGLTGGIIVPEPSTAAQFVSLLVALSMAIVPQWKRHSRRATLAM